MGKVKSHMMEKVEDLIEAGIQGEITKNEFIEALEELGLANETIDQYSEHFDDAIASAEVHTP